MLGAAYISSINELGSSREPVINNDQAKKKMAVTDDDFFNMCTYLMVN